jgi:hypothetical protein
MSVTNEGKCLIIAPQDDCDKVLSIRKRKIFKDKLSLPHCNLIRIAPKKKIKLPPWVFLLIYLNIRRTTNMKL